MLLLSHPGGICRIVRATVRMAQWSGSSNETNGCWPGINVVSAAELAGEMGPIENYASSKSIAGRAGLFPSRYQSDEVDRGGNLLGFATLTAPRGCSSQTI
ncbi:MAG: transposase [Planctomycetaceae bacterium]